MKIHAFRPSRAACAATAFARFPVDEHETVSKPKARAWERATATTRSLKLNVGRQTASFLMYRLLAAVVLLNFCASCGALNSGVKPTGNLAGEALGEGQQFGVAPHVRCPLGNALTADRRLQCVVVVGHFQRRKTVVADGAGLVSPRPSAFAAPQFVVRHVATRFLVP